MSRNAFAIFLDIPQPTLYVYEKNISEPAMSRLITIAQKCNTSTDWLCGLTSRRNSAEDMQHIMFVLDGLEPTDGDFET